MKMETDKKQSTTMKAYYNATTVQLNMWEGKMRCYKEQNATKLKAEGEKTRNNKEATKEKEHKHRGNAQPKKIESIKSEEIIIPQS